MSLMIVVTLVCGSTAGATMNTAEQANHLQMISKTFDHFRYKMTVENDSSNADFQKNALKGFQEDLENLQKQGVFTSEILSYLRTSILDASTQQDFDLMMSQIASQQLSSEEASAMIMQFLNAKYKNGASYAGGAAGIIALSLIISGVITVLVILAVDNNRHENCYYDIFGRYVCKN